jgi:hypothetical protein
MQNINSITLPDLKYKKYILKIYSILLKVYSIFVGIFC